MQRGEAFARLFEARAQAEREPRCHFIRALALLAEEIEWAAEAAAGGKFVDALAEIEKTVTDEAGERFSQIGDVFIELAAGLDDEFGGGGGRGSANIGDKIRDGEIGFVADAGDDGNLGSSDGASNEFLR